MADDDGAYERDLADILSDSSRGSGVSGSSLGLPNGTHPSRPGGTPSPSLADDTEAQWAALPARRPRSDDVNGSPALDDGSLSLSLSDGLSGLSSSPHLPDGHAGLASGEVDDEAYLAELQDVLGSDAGTEIGSVPLPETRPGAASGPQDAPPRPTPGSGSPPTSPLPPPTAVSSAQLPPSPQQPEQPKLSLAPEMAEPASEQITPCVDAEATPQPTPVEAPSHPTPPPPSRPPAPASGHCDQQASSASARTVSEDRIAASPQRDPEPAPAWVTGLDQQFSHSHVRAAQIRADRQRPKEFPALLRLRATPLASDTSTRTGSSAASASAPPVSADQIRGRSPSLTASLGSEDAAPPPRQRSTSVSTLDTAISTTHRFYPWGAPEQSSSRRGSVGSILPFAPANAVHTSWPLDAVEGLPPYGRGLDDHAFDGQGVPLTQGAGAHLLALEQQDLFHWTTMRQVTAAVFPATSPQAATRDADPTDEHEYEARLNSAVQIPKSIGQTHANPTAIATSHGLLAVGLSSGQTLVFTYGQQLQAHLVYEGKQAADTLGEVTALAFSHDGTFVGVGHGNGHILLWDLAKPRSPARHVMPVPLAAVRAGRREGHLFGSRVVRLSFLGARHTAIVSVDHTGLAFYHSLGKILGVSSNDTLRIFGRYSASPQTEAHTTILDMAALPLGSTSHLSDGHLFTAIAAPDKVVLCAVKPAARTWWRHKAPRLYTEGSNASSPLTAAVAWRPAAEGKRPTLACTLGSDLTLLELSVAVSPGRGGDAAPTAASSEHVELIEHEPVALPEPPLVLRWLDPDLLLLVCAKTFSLFDTQAHALCHTAPRPHPLADVLSHPWLPPVPLPRDLTHSLHLPAPSIGMSLAVAGKRLFVITPRQVAVGTLLTWADHLLALVSQGNFISAIRLATAYYVGAYPFFSYGLPRDRAERQMHVGGRLLELMRASSMYAFSEDRFRDSTHVSVDGRGVDRTEFFELLARTCAEASLDLGDTQFLWYDLYERYTDAGIESLFVAQMEQFILDGRMSTLPPEVVQRLLAFHTTRREYDEAARLVWHVQISCLDLDQVLNVCRSHGLYDALAYILNEGLHDFVAPLVELGDLVRRLLRFEANDASEEERRVANAYKVFSYLSVTLVGRQYPSQKPLGEPVASNALAQIYRTLFAENDPHWLQPVAALDSEPSLESKLATAHPVGTVAYPLLHILLALDAEALLDVIDLALENSYLDEPETAVITRQQITDVLLEISTAAKLQSQKPEPDGTGGVGIISGLLIDIFVARNAPKYPQFITLSPVTVKMTLERLATCGGEDTLADRELAAESLLANPVEGGVESLIPLFELAGWTHILARCYRRAKIWDKLLGLVLQNAEAQQSSPAHALAQSTAAALWTNTDDADKTQVFTDVRSIFAQCPRDDPRRISLEQQLASAAGTLAALDVAQTAILMDEAASEQQSTVLDVLASRSPEAVQLAYLACFFHWTAPAIAGVPATKEKDFPAIEAAAAAQTASMAVAEVDAMGAVLNPQRLPSDAGNLYISLVSGLVPGALLDVLQGAKAGTFDLNHVVTVAEEDHVYNALVWASNAVHGPDGALDTLDKIVADVGQSVAAAVALQMDEGERTLRDSIDALRSSFAGAVGIVTAAQSPSAESAPMSSHRWTRLVAALVSLNHMVALAQRSMGRKNTPAAAAAAELTEHTVSGILAAPAGKQVSFPTLVRALLGEHAESASPDVGIKEHATSAAAYPATRARYAADIRPVVQAISSAYRARADELDMARRAVQRDEAEAFDVLVRARRSGWRSQQDPIKASCAHCGLPVFYAPPPSDLDTPTVAIPPPSPSPNGNGNGNGSWTPSWSGGGPGTGSSTPQRSLSLLGVPSTGVPLGSPQGQPELRRPSVLTARGSVVCLPKRNSAPYLDGLPSPAIDKGKAPVRDKPLAPPEGEEIYRSRAGSVTSLLNGPTHSASAVVDYFTLPPQSDSLHPPGELDVYGERMATASRSMSRTGTNIPSTETVRLPASTPVLLARNGQAWHLACAPTSLVPRDPPVLLRSNSAVAPPA